MVWWSTSSGNIELNITKQQAASGNHPGECTQSIDELYEQPKIKNQLKKLDPELVHKELEEAGASPEEDNEENLKILLWLACGDIVDGNY